MQRKWTWLFLTGALVAGSGCDAFGPDDDAHMNVRLAGGASVGTQIASALLDDGAGGSPITLAAVDSIYLRITAIEAVRKDGEGDESWVRLALADSGKARVNLMMVPSVDSLGWRLARGDIPAGTYNGLRIRFDMSTATITLNREVTVGQQVYAAGTYPLEVPSGEQSGLKLPFATIVVGDDATADIVLKFDANTTVHTVATGSGRIKISPVLHAKATVEED